MTQTTSERLRDARELLRANQIDLAESEILFVLGGDPKCVPAQTLLAALYLKMGKNVEAEAILTPLSQENPFNPDATGLLAVSKKSQRKTLAALELFERLVRHGHRSVDLFNNIGQCWMDLGNVDRAGAAFKKAVELDRSIGSSFYNLGMALAFAGKSFETFATFKRAVELDPRLFDGYVQLWQQMRQLLNWREGLPILERGLEIYPKSAQMLAMVALTYGKVGRPSEAEALFKAAIEIDPSGVASYAHWLQEEGRFQDSAPLFKKAILANPLEGQPYYSLAVSKSFEIEGAPLKDRVTELLQGGLPSPDSEVFLRFALAKIEENERNFAKAIISFDRANESAYSLYNSDITPDLYNGEIEQDALSSIYSKSSIKSMQRYGSKSSLPIFVVGMIRTGTTLLDQILSSHPQIASAGEQPFWQVSAGRVNRRWLESAPQASDVRELENRYLEMVRTVSETTERVTDKMPTNFFHMGLMSVVFPKSKFIHIRRNPLDTCVSIYTTFLGSGTRFAYNRANIVAYYREYLRIMDFWRSVLPPGQMIEIDYETLVANKVSVVRELIEFCGLDWDDACLNHENNSSQVSTPSLYTARQPVSAASVERWRHYEPWLKELLDLRNVTHPPVGRADSEKG
jgi:tetratricopeptide (TPR) repeat protein